MRKISLNDIKIGMVVAADIFDHEFGGELPIIARGVELSNAFIKKLKERGITEVTVFTPEGYQGAPGETLAPETITENITFRGSVELHCDIPKGTKIEAGETITINGDIEPGCNITSAAGEVIVVGKLHGTNEKHIILSAAKRVTIKNTSLEPLSSVDIRSIGDVVIDGNITDSTVAAKGRLRIEGVVTHSRIYSQSRIRVKETGDGQSLCQLLVKPKECRDFFQELLALDNTDTELHQEKHRLQNTIDLVKQLGKDIESLPYENKVQMAIDIKRFRAIAGEITSGQSRKIVIKKKIAEILGSNRIFITEKGHPKTKITIENYSLELEAPVAATSFFVHDMKVEGDQLRE